jgi:hypothetical protein
VGRARRSMAGSRIQRQTVVRETPGAAEASARRHRHASSAATLSGRTEQLGAEQALDRPPRPPGGGNDRDGSEAAAPGEGRGLGRDQGGAPPGVAGYGQTTPVK